MNDDKKEIIEATRSLRKKVQRYIQVHGDGEDMDDVESALVWILNKLDQTNAEELGTNIFT